MISRGEGFIYWCRTAPFTSIGVVPFGIDYPLTPAKLLKVYPHVHLPAKRTLHRLLSGLVSRGGCWLHSPSLLMVVPLGPAAPHPGGRGCCNALPVQADILGLLRRVDERWCRLAVWVLPGEDHHHDPVSCSVMDCLLLQFSLLPHLSLIPFGLLCGAVLLQPAKEHLCHVEHLPGRRGVHRTGMSSQVAQELPVLWAGCAGALVPVGVIDVHRGSRRLCEGRKSDAKLSQLDVVACRHGGHVKGDGPPLANLLAAWKKWEWRK